MTYSSGNNVDDAVYLPTNEADLDLFMDEIIQAFELPDTDDTRDTIATMILHMPQACAKAPKRYFGESVMKSMANAAAFKKLGEYRQRREEAKLQKENPPEPSFEDTGGQIESQG